MTKYVWILICDQFDDEFHARYDAWPFETELLAQNALIRAAEHCNGNHHIVGPRTVEIF